MTELRINEEMKAYLATVYEDNEEVKKENDIVFNKETLPTFNNRIRSGNFYAVDKFGLMIRKNDFNNQKSPFGWVKNDDEILNIHVKIHEGITDLSKVKELTLRSLKTKFPTLFKVEKGILNRFYK
ncbi:MAG: hypothetical protein WC939_04040 [Acholeplasmataceae bacterium]